MKIINKMVEAITKKKQIADLMEAIDNGEAKLKKQKYAYRTLEVERNKLKTERDGLKVDNIEHIHNLKGFEDAKKEVLSLKGTIAQKDDAHNREIKRLNKNMQVHLDNEKKAVDKLNETIRKYSEAPTQQDYLDSIKPKEVKETPKEVKETPKAKKPKNLTSKKTKK